MICHFFERVHLTRNLGQEHLKINESSFIGERMKGSQLSGSPKTPVSRGLGLGVISSAKLFPTLQKKLFIVSAMSAIDLLSIMVSSPSLRALSFVVFDLLLITWFILF